MKRLTIVLTLLIGALAANAQQPTSFTYQGKLNSSSLPANGVYDFYFTVMDSLEGTGAIEQTVLATGVQVTNGVFTVNLSYPLTVWTANPGPRYLEIGVKPPSETSYLRLTPRQPIGSMPYATNALTATTALSAQNSTNSSTLGGLSPGSFVQIDPGTAQTGGFSLGYGTLSGAFEADTVNAATEFRLGGAAYLQNRGPFNLFFGQFAGFAFSTGVNNAGFGNAAGQALTDGGGNSLFGFGSGIQLQTGSGNTLVGNLAGSDLRNANDNTAIGAFSGLLTRGSGNVFVGSYSGSTNVDGIQNTLIGTDTKTGSINLTNAGAFGSRAMVSTNNSIVLGSINGVNGATADTNVGIGTTSPLSRLDVRGNLFVGLSQQPNVPLSFLTDSRSVWLANDSGDANNSLRIDGFGNNLYLISRSETGSVAGGGIVLRTATAGQGELDRVVVNPTGELRVNVLGAGGATPVCRNANNELSTCVGPLADDTKKNDEQDALIRRQQEQIERQRKEIDALKALICGTNNTADVCRQSTPKE